MEKSSEKKREKKNIYLFSEGNSSMKDILGSKGANLAEMASLGMPVPFGFTISSDVCNDYYKNNKILPDYIKHQIFEYISKIEKLSGKTLGNPSSPLLLSVRSGARVSMPGMMDTILNLGLNEEIVESFSKLTQNPRFAYDCFRRFIQMFSDVVKGIPKSIFEIEIEKVKQQKKIKYDSELNTEDLKFLVKRFKDIYKEKINEIFPSDPKIQLIEAVEAVFRSWDNPRANAYRKMHSIPYSWGTAVNVQVMVFGNFGEKSGTGVAFSRNPATGENKLFGEYLINAQGEDVVAGIRTPQPIEKLENDMPDIYKEFKEIANTLEKHYKDVQDMEFTVENGKLYMLQTRSAKRTAVAALKIAFDMVKEGKIGKEEALFRISPSQVSSLLHRQFEKKSLKLAHPIGKGLAASPGAASGKVVFTAEHAKKQAKSGEKVVLVRLETSAEDIEGMSAAEGILTCRGGMTSHAAVVARGMGRCCVSGCEEMEINEKKRLFKLGNKIIKEGDFISIDGSSGFVYGELIPTVPAEVSKELSEFMSWGNSWRKMKIFANADSPKDIKQALKLGAEGVGLCRTEHMFFEKERIKAIREMILAKDSESRKSALDKLLPYQKEDFKNMFLELKGLPMTVRLLDPPLHEFLPKKDEEIKDLAESLGISTQELNSTIEELKEFNPMMGHRGCRLFVSYPEIVQMQTSALIGAAIDVSKEHPEYNITPEIMIPLVSDCKEFIFVKKIIKQTATSLINQSKTDMKYKIGTMIELPRAALTADEIAKEADFFSFGTNDLTQMTFGFSRDDSSKFLHYYYENKIFETDPFQNIDANGVGKLIEMACNLGKKVKSDIKLGVCGEHGGDPYSIEFFNRLGLNYVSCSPFRLPAAKLAASQAEISRQKIANL